MGEVSVANSMRAYSGTEFCRCLLLPLLLAVHRSMNASCMHTHPHNSALHAGRPSVCIMQQCMHACMRAMLAPPHALSTPHAGPKGCMHVCRSSTCMQPSPTCLPLQHLPHAPGNPHACPNRVRAAAADGKESVAEEIDLDDQVELFMKRQAELESGGEGLLGAEREGWNCSTPETVPTQVPQRGRGPLKGVPG